jgi:hypothetical protein
LARVVAIVADGAPRRELVDAHAPMAAAPFAPEESTPLKATTVIEDATPADSVAVTGAFTGAAANARQISDVPDRAFERRTSCHVRPAPAIERTVVVERPSLDTNARSSSFAPLVDTFGIVTIVDALG